MSTSMNFNLRGVDSRVMSTLKQEAEKQHISINFLILKCIELGLGYSHKINGPIYHDLDYLAGTWNAKDADDFKENTAYFEKIDKDLWL